MLTSTSGSEVARLKQQILLEYDAAKNGLSGLSCGSSRHCFITTKMERMGVVHEQLIELVGADEAIKIIAESLWSHEERHGVCQGGMQ